MALVKHNNNSISAVTSMASLSTGSMTFIKEQTASSSASISFVDGSSDVVLDSTYPIYKFEYINIHPATDSANFMLNFRDGDSNFDATKTTTFFEAEHFEDDSGSGLAYNSAADLAQSTSDQRLAGNVGGDNDQCCNGNLFLFNPSSTTFVKHFMARTSNIRSDNAEFDISVAGYCNTTVAIDGVIFKFSSGNIDSGTIKLYGIKDS
jgi:hypothetical protein